MSYVVFCCLGIVLFGIAAFTRKLSVDSITPNQLQLISCLVHAVLIPLFLSVAPDNRNLNANNVSIAVLTTVLGIGGSLCLSYLLRGNVNAAVVSAILGLSPVVTFILSYLIFHDQLSMWKMFAFILAIISVIMVNF